MADTAQSPASASAAGTTSASPLTSTSAEVSPRSLKTPVLAPQVPHVDPSAVPVPSCASAPTSSVPSEAVITSPVKPSSDSLPLALTMDTTRTSSYVVSSNPPASLPVSESSALPDQVSLPSKVLSPPSFTADKTLESHSESILESGDKSSSKKRARVTTC